VTSDLTLHPMTGADYDEVVAFWLAQPGVGLNESDEREPVLAFLARNPGLSVVVRDEGLVVAAVLCGHDGRRGYLHHLAVAPTHRGRGLGRRLVDGCLRQLQASGIPKCNVFLFVDNDEGRRFWQAVGFAQRADLRVMQRGTEPGVPATRLP